MALVTRLSMLVQRASDQFAIAHTQVVFWRIATLCAHRVSEHLSSRVAEIALRRLLLLLVGGACHSPRRASHHTSQGLASMEL
jgi:hypothetical protein